MRKDLTVTTWCFIKYTYIKITCKIFNKYEIFLLIYKQN